MNAATVLVAAAMMTLALALAMTFAWRIWLRTRNCGWLDVVWMIAVGATGIVAALMPLPGQTVPGRALLVAAVVAAWTARLASHLYARNRIRLDDPRYHALVRHWGAQASTRMLLMAYMQALCSVPLVLAIWLAAHNAGDPLGLRDAIATAIAALGIGGAALADRQLQRFREHSGGAICAVRLWRYSRHPNYFFEWLAWCAFPVFAFDATGASSWAWLALAAPALMYVVLVYVSGVPPIEAHMLRTGDDAYRAYQALTRAFLPMPRAGAGRLGRPAGATTLGQPPPGG